MEILNGNIGNVSASGTILGSLIAQRGPQGETGKKGDTGENGYTPVKGVDYFDGKDGATYKPNVDDEGNLSWSNDKGLPNPETVNIKGEKGDTGDQGVQGEPGKTYDDTKIKSEIKRIINQVPSRSVEGENININDSADLPYKKLNIGGNSTQEGEPTPETPIEIKSVGDDVNLFDGEFPNVGYYANYNGGLSQQSDRKTTGFIKVNPNTTYSIKEFNDFLLDRINEFTDANNNTFVKSKEILSSNSTFTTSTTTEYIQFTVRTEEEAKVKLQKGEKSTAYSEYGKGTVEIKQSGKNLLDIPNKETSNFRGATISITDGTITLDGATTSQGVYGPIVSFQVPETTDYTLSMILSETFSSTWVLLDESEDNSTWSRKHEFNFSNKLATKTLNMSKDKYYRLMIYISGILTFSNLKIKLQLEKGTEEIEYEPYKGNNYVIPLSQPLRSLPNGVKDTIEEDGIHRRVKSIILDGVVNKFTIFASDANNRAAVVFGSALPNNYQTENSYCSHFDYNINVYKDSDDEIGFICTATRSYFRFSSSSDKKTIGLANSWLAEQYANGMPVTLNFPLAKEVIEPFDEEQQAVIDEIYNTGTFKGVTNINSSSLIEPEFDIEYYKDLEILFNNLSQAIIGGN